MIFSNAHRVFTTSPRFFLSLVLGLTATTLVGLRHSSASQATAQVSASGTAVAQVSQNEAASPEGNDESEIWRLHETIPVSEIVIVGTDESELQELIFSNISTVVGETTNRETVQNDFNKIYETGYFRNIRINTRRESGTELKVIINVEPVILNDIRIESREPVSPEEKAFFEGLLRELQGEIITPSKGREWRERADRFYASNDIPHIITSSRFSRETGELELRIDETIDEILVSGTDEPELQELARNAVTGQTGSVYESQNLQASSDAIYDIGYFSSVSVSTEIIAGKELSRRLVVDVVPVTLSETALEGVDEFVLVGQIFIDEYLASKVGEVLTPSKLAEWGRQFDRFYSESGFPQLVAVWRLTTATGKLTFEVKEGVVGRRGVRFQGVDENNQEEAFIDFDSAESEFDRIISSYIWRTVTWQEGDSLDVREIEAAIARIESFGLFDNVEYSVNPIRAESEADEIQPVEVVITVDVPLDPAQRSLTIGQRLTELSDDSILRDAEILLDRSSILFQERNDDIGSFNALSTLCNLYSDEIFYVERTLQQIKTVDTCLDWLDFSMKLNSGFFEFIALTNVADAYRVLGEQQAALSFYREAYEKFALLSLDDSNPETLLGEYLSDSFESDVPEEFLSFLGSLAWAPIGNSGNSYFSTGSLQQALYSYVQSLNYASYFESGRRSSILDIQGDSDGQTVIPEQFMFFNRVLAYSGMLKIYKSLNESKLSQEFAGISTGLWLNFFGFVSSSEGSQFSVEGSGLRETQAGVRSVPFTISPEDLDVENFSGDFSQLMAVLFSYNQDSEERMLEFTEYFIDFLEESEEFTDLAFWLTSQGDTYFGLERYNEALAAYSRADRIAQASLLPVAVENAIQLGLAKTYRELGEEEQSVNALNNLQNILLQGEVTISQSARLRSLANLHYEFGETYLRFDRYNDALAAYSEARDIWESSGDSLRVSDTLHKMAVTHSRKGEFEAARRLMELSLAELELGGAEKADRIASQLEGYSIQVYKTYQELSNYFQSKREYYDFYIQLLTETAATDSNRVLVREAFEVSEQAHARTLELFLSRAKTRVTEQGEATTDLTAEAFRQTQALSLEEIQRQVLTDDETLLLEYSLGDEQSHLWIVSQNEIHHYPLPGREEIESKALAFYRYLTVPDQRVRPRKGTEAGEALVEAILPQEAQAQLEGKTRLAVVGDGILQYIPFHALPNPDPTTALRQQGSTWADYMEPMLVEYEVTSLPSASALAAIRRRQSTSPAREIAVFADPVFGHEDSRFEGDLNDISLVEGIRLIPDDVNIAPVFEPEQLFSRLPGTQTEASTILALADDLTSRRWDSFEATRKAAMNDLSNYRIVHFATHGLLDVEQPQRSGIMLSVFNESGVLQQNLVSTVDTFNMKLNADLVVLSGCRTGLDADLSAEDIRGEGLFGMTGGLMYAGAERVVPSLWSVQNNATNELMERFYQNIYDDTQDITISESLRQAQISMWQSDQWQNPYYWAAFTLQGEWE